MPTDLDNDDMTTMLAVNGLPHRRIITPETVIMLLTVLLRERMTFAYTSTTVLIAREMNRVIVIVVTTIAVNGLPT